MFQKLRTFAMLQLGRFRCWYCENHYWSRGYKGVRTCNSCGKTETYTPRSKSRHEAN